MLPTIGKGVLVVLAGFLLIVMLIGGLQSCSALVGAAGGGVAASSYRSEDADILAAEAAYCALEAELQEFSTPTNVPTITRIPL